MAEERILKLRTIKREIGLSLHAQILQQLREMMENDIWVSGQKLPTEKELQHFFGVSRSTIREALSDLVSQGYIYRQAGKGTFVSPAKIADRSMGTGGFVQQRYGSKAKSIILDVSKITSSQLDSNTNLDTRPNTYVIKFNRLLLEDEIPFGLTTVCAVLANDVPITRKELEEFSLAHILREFGRVKIVRIERSLEAVLASEVEEQILKVALGSPLLLSKSVRFADNGDRVGIVKALYRGDRYKYKINIML